MKNFITSVCLLLMTVTAFPQTKNITVTGRILEADTKEPAVQANVQLLQLPDSTYKAGIASTARGYFTLPKVAAGKYVLKVSYVGFKTKMLPLTLSTSKTERNVGTLELETDAVLLSEAVVTAEAPMVQVVEDTLVFNSSAYRTPDGAMLEELVKKFPGAEVDDDGNIKINGKEVKKIMVNGKEFFGGDVKTGMKNLPVEMVEKVKTYDKKSDLARITGIDDGEEETVLDLTVKKGMNQGIFGNFDLAGGTEDRYLGRGMMNYFREKTQVSVIGGANNVNDRGMSGGGGGPRFRGGGGGNGTTATKTLGVSFATETDKLELGGSARYNYRDNDAISRGYSESFLANNNSYSNSNSISNGRSEDFNAEFRMEWRPNEMTNIIFRPNFSYSKTNSFSNSESGTFRADPYGEIYKNYDPNNYLNLDSLEQWGDADDPFYDIRINASNNASFGEGSSLSAGATLQLNRKLNDEGRNITFQGRFSYSDSDNDSYSESFTRYYRDQNMPEQSILRYSTSPSKRYSYSGRLMYSEPIAYATFLQFSYQLEYSYNKSDRSVYDLTQTAGGSNWRLYDPLPDDYLEHKDTEQSKFAEYKYLNHDAGISLRLIRDKYQLNAGLTFRPQHTELSYKKNKLDTIVKRDVFNFSPNVNLRIRFSKVSRLELTYRGNSSQPGMENLLPVTDNSNPLNIQVGNPDLKPSFNHNFNLFFNDYKMEMQRGIMANARFSFTQNQITQIRTYNEETGGWTNTSANINGNWNASAGFGFNTALRNQVDKSTEKNTTTNLNLNESLRGAYRNDWLELALNGNISYSWEKDKLRSENNQEPYTFSYGANLQLMAPWRMTFTTNIANQCRRGYTDSNMNRDELVWNAQLSQTFLKGKATVTFEMYDILKNQSNISRTLSSSGRSVYQYNGVNSYCMLHFLYRLNIFGNKDARRGMRGRGGFGGPDDGGGFGGGRGGRGFGGGGGFGGGRPF